MVEIMSLYTVFGGRGFIGSEIVKQLKLLGHNVFVPERDDESIYHTNLGTVIYCAGHGDCKNAPFAVLDANVSLLSSLLQRTSFERLLYMSSTRVYMNQEASSESVDLTVCFDDNRRLFNLTKLVAEELCLKSSHKVCIVRPSNVYGVALNSSLFLPSITRNAINTGHVDMYIAQDYSKDYVSVYDVAESCIYLCQHLEFNGQIINVAAGYNVSAAEVADVLIRETGCTVTWHNIDFPREIFVDIDIRKIRKYIPHYFPRNVLDDMYTMINDFRVVNI